MARHQAAVRKTAGAQALVGNASVTARGHVGHVVFACSIISVGLSSVAYAQERVVTVHGTVTSQTSGRPIPSVSVVYDGTVFTLTDRDGRYAFRLPVTRERIDVTFQRIGFRRHVEARDLAAGDSVVVDASLIPVPTVLEEITVDGRQLTIRNPGLVGFYERRELGYGQFITEPEIERAKGFDLTNLVRRLRFPTDCPPFVPVVYYLDGIRVVDMPGGEDGGTSAYERINNLIAPSQLGGIELYRDERAVRLPREFIPAGPYCAIAMFWTREPKGPSPATLTAHLGSLVGRGSNSRFAVGAGFRFPLRTGSTLQFDASAQVPLERSSDLWRLFVAATGRPFGFESPWYVGMGAALIKPRGTVGSSVVTSIAASPMLLTGLRLRHLPINPFVEFRVLDPTSPDRTSGMLVTGLNLDIGN